MSIEFQCGSCQHILKVPEEHAGKSARCPACGQVTSIPLTTMSHDAATELGATQDYSAASPDNPFADNSDSGRNFAGQNPYRSPSSSKLQTKTWKSGNFKPTAASFDEIINVAWTSWKDNLGIAVVALLIANGIPAAVSFVANVLQAGLLAANVDELIAGLVLVVLTLLGNVVQIFMSIGQTRLYLKLIRGQKAELSELFSGGNVLLPVVGASILFGIMIFFGLIALLIGALFVALLFWPFFILIVDREVGITEAFGLAYAIGKLNLLTSFIIFISAIGFYFVGLLMLCIGVIFTMSLYSMVVVAAYLKMTNQI